MHQWQRKVRYRMTGKLKVRKFAIFFTVAVMALEMTACRTKEEALPDLSSMGTVVAVSREEGSGTRDEFESLLNISEADTETAAESTEDVLQIVEEATNAIGYVAYSATTDIDGKILQIDGVLPSEETISRDSYSLCRDYYLAYEGELTDVERDFLTYVMSKGQEVVEEYCVPVKTAKTFLSDQSEGKIVIDGSTSMESMVEALADGYMEENPNAEIEVNATDSTSGLTSAISGGCDIAMSSRSLKDYESELLEVKSIGRDAVAVVVNEENPLESITTKQLKSLYDGTCTNWSDLK